MRDWRNVCRGTDLNFDRTEMLTDLVCNRVMIRDDTTRFFFFLDTLRRLCFREMISLELFE
jgi:hypothetical protein